MDLLYGHEQLTRYQSDESDSETREDFLGDEIYEGLTGSTQTEPHPSMPFRKVRDLWQSAALFRWAPNHVNSSPHTLVITVGTELSSSLTRLLTQPYEPLAIAVPFGQQVASHFNGLTSGRDTYYIFTQQANPKVAYLLLNAPVEEACQFGWIRTILSQLRPQKVVVIDTLASLQRETLLDSIYRRTGPTEFSANTHQLGRFCYLRTTGTPSLTGAEELHNTDTVVLQGIAAGVLTQCQVEQIPAYFIISPDDKFSVLEHPSSFWEGVAALGVLGSGIDWVSPAQVTGSKSSCGGTLSPVTDTGFHSLYS
ncbi:hypothetical protein IWQ61_002608 [Dispira simplex]|nr:hypothetical protein IWQ61_002608 [Dispira simplex]